MLPSFLVNPGVSPDWQIPKNWRRIRTIDLHTGGEPLRVILDGFPELNGKTILDYRNYVRENWDILRTALMWEPRGHADMYGCLLTPPVSPEADFGTFFLHNEGYSTMCGHAIIALATWVVQTRQIQVIEPETCVKIDTPAGLITAYTQVENGQVQGVRFHNVPSFVAALDQGVEVPDLGMVRYDLAFGGAFYAYVQAESLGLDLGPDNVNAIIQAGMDIKRAVMASSEQIVHPFEEDLSFLYGTIFISPAKGNADNRNVCIFAEGEVDRSPTGTGVSGRMALHYARNEIAIGERMTIESIIGSSFQGSIVDETTFGPFAAIIPEVSGTAFITGQHEFLIDPNDPLRDGFILR